MPLILKKYIDFELVFKKKLLELIRISSNIYSLQAVQ